MTQTLLSTRTQPRSRWPRIACARPNDFGLDLEGLVSTMIVAHLVMHTPPPESQQERSAPSSHCSAYRAPLKCP